MQPVPGCEEYRLACHPTQSGTGHKHAARRPPTCQNTRLLGNAPVSSCQQPVHSQLRSQKRSAAQQGRLCYCYCMRPACLFMSSGAWRGVALETQRKHKKIKTASPVRHALMCPQCWRMGSSCQPQPWPPPRATWKQGCVLTPLHEQHLLDAAWADAHTAPRSQHLVEVPTVSTADPHGVPGQPRGWQVERLQPVRETQLQSQPPPWLPRSGTHLAGKQGAHKHKSWWCAGDIAWQAKHMQQGPSNQDSSAALLSQHQWVGQAPCMQPSMVVWCDCGCFQSACTEMPLVMRSTCSSIAAACSAGKAAASSGPAVKLTRDEATVLMSFRPRGRSSLKALNTPGRAKGRVECGSNPAVQVEQCEACKEPQSSATATDTDTRIPNRSPVRSRRHESRSHHDKMVCSRSLLLPADNWVLENKPDQVGNCWS